MKKRCSWLRVCSGVAAGLVLGLLAGCGEEPPQVSLAPITGGGEEPTMLFEGFRMVSTRGHNLEWEFQARAAQIYEKIHLAKSQDIRINYIRNGKIVSTLTARRGIIHTDNNNFRAENQVEMVSQEGVHLYTESLQWDQARQLIYTDKPVRVVRQGSVLTGVGLETDSEMKRLQVLSQVKINVRSVKELENSLAAPSRTPAP